MPKANTPSGLTPKIEHFVAEYIIDKNAARAARAAGYTSKSATRYASELLAKPEVRKAVDKALKAQMTRTLITADNVLRRLDRLAEKAEGEGDYVAAIRANQLLGQHYKLFTEKHEHGGLDGGPVKTETTHKLPADVEEALTRVLGAF